MIDMKLCPNCSVSRSVSEFGKNKVHKDGLSWYCKPCNRAKHKIHRDGNTETLSERAAAYYVKNKEKILSYHANWYKDNRAGELKRVQEYYQQNKESIRTYKQEYLINNRDRELARKQLWADCNRETYRASKARRRAYKILATPLWADHSLIKKYYKIAIDKSAETGIEWHVDHIVPLKSQFVCGLHWEGNLQVLSGKENIAKGNRVWPDMPDKASVYVKENERNVIF